MKAPLRFRSLAMAAALSGAAGPGAPASAAEEPDVLPSIFAPKRPVPLPPPLLERRTPSSERVAGMIKERVMERAKQIEVSTLPIRRAGGDVSPVVMEAFAVRADKVRRVDPEEKLTPAMRFLKTGRFFESADGTLTGDARLVPVKPSGALPKEDVPRVEISFTKKF